MFDNAAEGTRLPEMSFTVHVGYSTKFGKDGTSHKIS